VNLTLKRGPSTDQGTLGQILWDERLLWYSGELPWRENNVGISCIPKGEYEVEPWDSKRFPGTYHVKNVQGRTAILIHTGNLFGDKSKGYLSHVLGCILIGKSRGAIRGQKAVLLSGVALRELRELVGRNNFRLSIEEG